MDILLALPPCRVPHVLHVILCFVAIAQQTGTSVSDTNKTHVKYSGSPEKHFGVGERDGDWRYLHGIDPGDLPHVLYKSCALIGILPCYSQPGLESVLMELSHVFRDEPSVFIGQFIASSLFSNVSRDIPESRISWEGPFKDHHIGDGRSKDLPSCLAYFKREVKDRACLLNHHKTTFRAVSYTGQASLEILVQFINEQCGVFRTPQGTLTNAGLLQQHLLGNLYMPKDWVEECLEIRDIPTKAEFFKEYLFRSKPVIIKNALRNSPIVRKWSSNYLRGLYGNKQVHVKLTEDGIFEGVESVDLWSDYHDDHIPDTVKSQLKFPDLVVVRPATREMLFSKFLDLILAGNLSYSAYLEYSSIPHYMPELIADIHELPFLDGELIRSNLNMWLSDGNTLGKLHFDPFDNFLCQVSGVKQLTLFDPHHNENLYEAHIPEAILTFNPSTNKFSRETLLESTSMVMSPVDLQFPDLQRFPNFRNARRVHCTLSPGDVLFMPAFWWHEVQSYPDLKEMRNLAINFWYKPVFSKEFPCEDCRLGFNLLYKHLLHNPPT